MQKYRQSLIFFIYTKKHVLGIAMQITDIFIDALKHVLGIAMQNTDILINPRQSVTSK